MTDSTFDALIIGGGPGGATSALLLAKAGWSVGVVEKAVFPRKKVCGEFLSGSNWPLLRDLGVAESFVELAGPEVRQVGLFAGDHAVTSEMPRTRTGDGWGRALGRDQLDTMLLDRAAAAGAHVFQPWSAAELVRVSDGGGDGYVCQAVNKENGQSKQLRARIVVAAHGSWETGHLPTQQAARPAPKSSDLFGFKAHFLDGRLPAGLMPLLAFPGGYGGMVHSDHGRVSLSCCIRRDQLQRARRAAGAVPAGEAVIAHIKQSCRPVREALAGAILEHRWLSAGPIQPGIRSCGFDRIFLVGNAAGEAHPAVAEGIGMAMQSASLLCERLIAESAGVLSSEAVLSNDAVDTVRRDYASAWRRTLAPRIHAAAVIAHWAMRPQAVACVSPLLRMFPGVLTAGARLSGKTATMNRTMTALPLAS